MSQVESFFAANALYLWLALAAAVVLALLWLLAVQLRLNRVVYSHNQLIGGVDEGNLEDSLGRQIAYILETKAKVETLQSDLARTRESLDSPSRGSGSSASTPSTTRAATSRSPLRCSTRGVMASS